MDVALGNPIDVGRAAVSRDPDENLTGIREVLQMGVPTETQLRIRMEIRVRTLTTQVGILEMTQAQAWQKYLISGIDRYRYQNRKVLIILIPY
jgi:hypothetical protein